MFINEFVIALDAVFSKDTNCLQLNNINKISFYVHKLVVYVFNLIKLIFMSD